MRRVTIPFTPQTVLFNVDKTKWFVDKSSKVSGLLIIASIIGDNNYKKISHKDDDTIFIYKNQEKAKSY